jgi:3-deoxy-7-phosphoheptulonate synthase
MIVVMEKGATEEQIEAVIEKLVEMEFVVHRSTGAVHTVLGGVGPTEKLDPEEFKVMDGVLECHRILAPYQLAGRGFRPEGTVIHLERTLTGSLDIGGSNVVVAAGPGLVDDERLAMNVAERVRQAGARLLLGGGTPAEIEEPADDRLKLLRRASDANGLFLACEVPDTTRIGLVSEYADVLMVSSRNMENHALLRALGALRKPVMLARSVGATLEELLTAADIILRAGNYDVILCERGIRTFETYTKYTLDLAAVPVLKKLSHLPVIVDPSSATGRRDKVAPMARAAVAAGADGVLIDVHPDPGHSPVEGAQWLSAQQFDDLMKQLKTIAAAVGRTA